MNEQDSGDEVTERKSGLPVPKRFHLLDERNGVNWKLMIGDLNGVQLGAATMVPKGGYYVKAYLNTGEFDDGQLGEVFLKPDKEGSFVTGTLDGFALLLSIALQHGIPLKDIAAKFLHSRFEPSGFTNDDAVPMASSFFDLMFRKLCLRYLDPEDLEELGIADRRAGSGRECTGDKEEDDGPWEEERDFTSKNGQHRPTAGLSGEPFNR